VVPLLEPCFSLVLFDLRDYGAFSTVQSENGPGYSKRLMAQDAVPVMKQLGYEKFSVLSHD
jgi:haloacetate dehalogenase